MKATKLLTKVTESSEATVNHMLVNALQEIETLESKIDAMGLELEITKMALQDLGKKMSIRTTEKWGNYITLDHSIYWDDSDGLYDVLVEMMDLKEPEPEEEEEENNE